MKRSEMIAKLDKEFGIDKVGAGTSQASSEDIILFLEKNGMCPFNVCWLATGEYSPVKELMDLAQANYDASVQWEEE